MPVTVGSSRSNSNSNSRHGSVHKERRLSGSNSGRRAGSSIGGGRSSNNGKTSTSTSSSSSSYMSSAASTLSSYMPSVLLSSRSSNTPSHASSDDHPPIKSILVVNNKEQQTVATTEGQKQEGDGDDKDITSSSSSSSSSASSYLKPLLKFLPRHIDPATIARLLKNVHPTAFGSYRTKEAWRREHPEVLTTAQHILAQEQREEEARLRGDTASYYPSSSSSVDEFCLAHSPPSATFSSSSEEEDDDDGGIDEVDEDADAKELEEMFDDKAHREEDDDIDDDDPFDANLGSSPESVSSLRDLAERRDSFTSSAGSNHHHVNSAIGKGKGRERSSDNDGSRMVRLHSGSGNASDNDSAVEIISIHHPPRRSLSSSNHHHRQQQQQKKTTSPPRSPLAILVSRPKEEDGSPDSDSDSPETRILRGQADTVKETRDQTPVVSLWSATNDQVPHSRGDQAGKETKSSSTSSPSPSRLAQQLAAGKDGVGSNRQQSDGSPTPGDSNITITPSLFAASSSSSSSSRDSSRESSAEAERRAQSSLSSLLLPSNISPTASCTGLDNVNAPSGTAFSPRLPINATAAASSSTGESTLSQPRTRPPLPSPSWSSSSAASASSSASLSSPLSPPSPSSLSSSRQLQQQQQQRIPFPHTSSSSSSISPISASPTPSPSNNGYPTISIPKQVRRQRSSSSLASACTCRSNASNISNASGTSSRSSSVRFAPLPEDELLKTRRESQQRSGGGAVNEKSRVMGIKGRRTLLLGKTEDGKSVDEILRAKNTPVPPQDQGRGKDQNGGAVSLPNDAQSKQLGYRRPVLTEEEEEEDNDEYGFYGGRDSDDDDDYRHDGRRARRGMNGDDDNDAKGFDAIAYFGEVDLLPQPLPSSGNTKHSNSRTRGETARASSLSSPTSGSSALQRKEDGQALSAPVSEAEKPSSTHYFRQKWNQKSLASAQNSASLYGKNGELVEKRPLGVTLEELTLPMKRVKETRGRSRQTMDLSASFSASKAYSATQTPSSSAPSSLPNSPGHGTRTEQQMQMQMHTHRGVANGDNLSELSPSRSYLVSRSTEVAWTDKTTLPDASEKTPVPTPRFEKSDLFLTAVVPPASQQSSSSKGHMEGAHTVVTSLTGSAAAPRSSTTTSSSSKHSRIRPMAPMSPTSAGHSNDTIVGSPTSPSNSSGFSGSGGGSNDITPMPTPRAGSPVAGLKMTAAVFAQSEASKRDFKLLDALTARRGSNASNSSSSESSNGLASPTAKEASSLSPAPERLEIRALKMPNHQNVARSCSPAGMSPVPSLSTSTSNSSPEPEDGTVDPATGLAPSADEQDEWDSEDAEEEDQGSASAGEGEHVQEVEIAGNLESMSPTNSAGFEGDYDKTPTLHSTLALPKIYDIATSSSANGKHQTSSNTASASRFRKKIVIATPHATASAKKRNTAKKAKKTTST